MSSLGPRSWPWLWTVVSTLHFPPYISSLAIQDLIQPSSLTLHPHSKHVKFGSLVVGCSRTFWSCVRRDTYPLRQQGMKPGSRGSGHPQVAPAVSPGALSPTRALGSCWNSCCLLALPTPPPSTLGILGPPLALWAAAVNGVWSVEDLGVPVGQAKMSHTSADLEGHPRQHRLTRAHQRLCCPGWPGLGQWQCAGDRALHLGTGHPSHQAELPAAGPAPAHQMHPAPSRSG